MLTDKDKVYVYEYLFKRMQMHDNDYRAAVDSLNSGDAFPSDYNAAAVAYARKMEVEEIACELFRIFSLTEYIKQNAI